MSCPTQRKSRMCNASRADSQNGWPIKQLLGHGEGWGEHPPEENKTKQKPSIHLHKDHNFSRETELDWSRVRQGTHGQSQGRHHYCPSPGLSPEKPLLEHSVPFIFFLYPHLVRAKGWAKSSHFIPQASPQLGNWKHFGPHMNLNF